MRRRITWAMVVVVAAALVLAGVVTLVVGIRASRQSSRHELAREASGLAVALRTEATLARPVDPALSLRRLLRALKAPLRLQDAAVVAITPAGRLLDPANPRRAPTLPAGLRASDLDLARLLGLRSVAGQRGGLIYTAAPFDASVAIGARSVAVVQAVVLTRRAPGGLAAVGPWFLGSAVAILLVTVVVADRLARRFIRPLQAVEATTRRIAGGDLDARVAAPADIDPELSALAASVNTMADGLARSRQVERQFLLSVSHDLRTPLTSIRGYAEAIQDGVVDDPAGAASIITAEAGRLERLVGDLLDLARFETRGFDLRLDRVDLARVVAVTASGFTPSAAGLGLRLIVDVDRAAGPVVLADADRLGQVVANLVENALSFAGTTVTVGVGSAGGRPALWVDDDGPGIGPEAVDRVFERLYSARPEPSRRLGSGLGLAIVSGLVQAMGGTVAVTTPGSGDRGTRFLVTLPAWAGDPGQLRAW